MENIGGQAVIEGVMMKSRKGWTVAVRGPKGDIHVKRETLKSIPKILMLPVLRGVVALYQALSLGITIVFSFILGIALFILLPLYVTNLLGIIFSSVSKSSLVFNLVDGIIRIIFVLLYLIAIGMWKEMRRIFEYHGAEHKVIQYPSH